MIPRKKTDDVSKIITKLLKPPVFLWLRHQHDDTTGKRLMISVELLRGFLNTPQYFYCYDTHTTILLFYISFKMFFI